MNKLMEIIIKIIMFLNSNEGVVDSVLSFVSLIIAISAIIISVITRKEQTKIDLFEKRYEIYVRFSELINMAKLVTNKNFTYKGKLMNWNESFFGVKTESSQLGVDITELDDKLKSMDRNSEEYKTISEERKEKVNNKFFIDCSTLEKDRTMLGKCRLLFPDRFANSMEDFFNKYTDVVFSANYMDEEYMIELFEQWGKICIELDDNNYLNRMQQFLDFKE